MFVGEPLAEPVVPEPGPAGPEVVGPFHRLDVAAGDVEVARGPERGVHRVREQLGRSSSIACPSDRSARKARTSSGRGQRADHVERDPAEELGVGRRARGCDAQGAELGVDLAVDRRRQSGTSGTVTTRPVGTTTRAAASRPLYEATTAVSPGRRPRTRRPVATSATASSRTRRSQNGVTSASRAVGEPGDDREPADRARPFEVATRAGRISIRSAAGRAGSRRAPAAIQARMTRYSHEPGREPLAPLVRHLAGRP